jgi:hypothetical protein
MIKDENHSKVKNSKKNQNKIERHKKSALYELPLIRVKAEPEVDCR